MSKNLHIPKFRQFTQEYGILDEHAVVLTDSKDIAGYFLETTQFTKNHRAIANWLTSTIKGYLNEKSIEISELSLKPSQLMDQDLWDFKNLEKGLISGTNADETELFTADEFENIEE